MGATNSQYSRFLNFHGRNPDVLNSIANLSNDEVFTPPEFANRMLDTLQKAWADSNNGENLWANSNVKFLDPFTKSGVFLREISTRLIKGLEQEIPDLQERVDHILTKQVFGIATTHLTSLMARRSLYCSKKANGKHSVTKKFKDESGNIWFEPMSHTWGKGTVREITMDESGNEIEQYVDGKCKYCGASKRDFDRSQGLELHAYGLIHTDDPKKWVGEIFGSDMQFDVIIGNPPYQLEDGGHGVSAAPVYHKFVLQAMDLDPRLLCMVTPSRWFAGGKGLDEFREQMLSDERISHLVDYIDSTSVFPGVSIRGGVSFFVWDASHTGEATIETVEPDLRSSITNRKLREPGMDVFIRFNGGISILEKVRSKVSADLASHGERDAVRWMNSLVSSRKPFGLPTDFKAAKTRFTGSLEVFSKGGEVGYLNSEAITKGSELIDKWKIFVAYASSGDELPNVVLPKPFLAGPGKICTETYLAIGPFDSETEAANALTYMKTRFFRFLVLLRKASQHVTQSVYSFVPLLEFSKSWSDEELFEKFGLSKSEKELIFRIVKPMGEA